MADSRCVTVVSSLVARTIRQMSESIDQSPTTKVEGHTHYYVAQSLEDRVEHGESHGDRSTTPVDDDNCQKT